MSQTANIDFEDFQDNVRRVLIRMFGIGRGKWMWEAGQKINDLNARYQFYRGLLTDLKKGKPERLRDLMRYRVGRVVGIVEFIESDLYLGMRGELYPKIMDEIVEMNNGMYQEAVLTGAIGTGKTTIAVISTCYQLYLLSILRNPHDEFDLQPSSEITFIFQSINATLAKSVDFSRFRSMVSRSPYFKEFFSFEADLQTEMRFPNRIIVKAVSGQESGTIGQNVIGGVIDELNFMAMIENSTTHTGGYDQAVSLYNSIARRRKSRFMKKGKLPGLLCLVSSKRYPGEFTERKVDEAKTDPTIFVYDKRVWDIKPEGTYTGQWFDVFIGDANHKSRIVDELDPIPDRLKHLVMPIPVEYRQEFENDITNALRDIAGVSTRAMNPYFTDVESVSKSFNSVVSILSREDCNFESTSTIIYPKRFTHPTYPRWVHIDLSVSSDSTGIACGYVPEFTEIQRGSGQVEKMPVIRYDFLLRVNPPPNGEIKFFKVRELLYKLRELGLNIRWISFDSYQSTDSIQMLRQKGFSTGMQSIDTSMLPYDVLKSAMYDRRILAPPCEHAKKELLGLERDLKKGKIDHPPNGSKDLSDAMAGVAYGLTMRKDTYLMHGISLMELPESVRAIVAKSKDNMQEGSSDLPTVSAVMEGW